MMRTAVVVYFRMSKPLTACTACCCEQVQSLRDRLAESDSGTQALTSAAQEADHRCEELVSQLQQARGQAFAARREADALTGQVRS